MSLWRGNKNIVDDMKFLRKNDCTFYDKVIKSYQLLTC